MDAEAQKMIGTLAKTHDNLAAHVLALTALVGAMMEKGAPERARVQYWAEAVGRGQSGISTEQVVAVALGILGGPSKAQPEAKAGAKK
jgi:homoserine acetyltransferase